MFKSQRKDTDDFSPKELSKVSPDINMRRTIDNPFDIKAV